MLHCDAIVNICFWSGIMQGKFKKCIWDSVFFAMIWNLWFLRNEIKFNNKVFNPSELIDHVKNKVSDWIVSYCPKFPYPSYQVHRNLQAIWCI